MIFLIMLHGAYHELTEFENNINFFDQKLDKATYEKLFLTFDFFYSFDKKCKKNNLSIFKEIFFIFLYNLILS